MDLGPDRRGEHWKVCGCLCRGGDRRLDQTRSPRRGLRNECARFDRGHRRYDRSLNGCPKSRPIYNDCRDGRCDHNGDATDVALGIVTRATSQGRKKRFEREAMEAKQFVPNLERLLLAVDSGPNGQFTSHLAGLVAGSRGMPITVLPLDGANQKPCENKEAESEHVIDEIIKAAASSATRSMSDEPTSVEVTIRPALEPIHEEAITIEAKKGYDLLFIGLEKMKTPRGALNSRIDEIAAAFEGPMATVIAQGRQLEEPTSKTLGVLVPITGTDVSRRAAEIAFSLGKGATVTALYVEQKGWAKAGSGRLSRRQARTILNDIAEMASRYNIKIKTRRVSDVELWLQSFRVMASIFRSAIASIGPIAISRSFVPLRKSENNLVLRRADDVVAWLKSSNVDP
jgi:hypothetical protein